MAAAEEREIEGKGEGGYKWKAVKGREKIWGILPNKKRVALLLGGEQLNVFMCSEKRESIIQWGGGLFVVYFLVF